MPDETLLSVLERLYELQQTAEQAYAQGNVMVALAATLQALSLGQSMTIDLLADIRDSLRKP